MKKFLLMAVVAFAFSSCQEDDFSNGSAGSFNMAATSADLYPVCDLPVATVAGSYNDGTTHTWDNDHVWEIDGVFTVTDGSTLVIEPGTYIKAKAGTSAPNGVLVITKTGIINAAGTASNPIVFTSDKLLDCDPSTTPAAGDFGGVILLGKAPVNSGDNNQIEGLPAEEAYTFGGQDTGDNRGTLQYVRIEYAGTDLSGPNSGNEVNGLTLGGVGAGTTIDHIQVSYGLDDGIEFFGGTVNLDHVIVFAQADDGLDFDNGYTGSVTQAVVLADYYSEHTGVENFVPRKPDSNGIELDNNSSGTEATPITRPVIKDLSIIGVSTAARGKLYENGIHVRRNGQIDLTNVTVTGYGTGIYWQGPSTPNQSSFTNLKVHGFDNPVVPNVNLGFLNFTSTANPATTWGLSQPFYNDGGFNLGGNFGAFETEQGWAEGAWTQYFGS